MNPFVAMFSGDDERYCAAIILTEELPVSIRSEDEAMAALLIDQPDEETFYVVADEFPDIFLESGVTMDEALWFVEKWGLNLQDLK